MKQRIAKHSLAVLLAAVLLITSLLNAFNSSTASADELQNRSVQLSSTQTSVPASESFQFVVPTTSTIGSVVFEYCDNSPLLPVPCSAPAGLDVTAATITSQVGNTGFNVDTVDSSANRLVIGRTPLAGSNITTAFGFDNITNPSTEGQTVFVRISTHAASDGSGAANDSGAVAFVTSSPLSVAAFVPPFLRMCVGITVATDCSSSSGDTIDLGILSASHANAGQSQFATGSNSPSGYAVYSLGTTMTSGNNAIPALASPTPSFPGNNQFGINLRANSNPPSGQDSDGVGVATPTTNYNQVNQFMFDDGDLIASSNIPSDYNRMTVSYLVNVNHSQPPRVYSTTITYLAVAQF